MLISLLPPIIKREAEKERARQKELGINRSKIDCDSLSYAFNWEESVKGKKYWEKINKQKLKIHEPLSNKKAVGYW